MEENEDIISQEIERVRNEQLEAEKEAEKQRKREEYVKEQKKKEIIIHLDFSDLGNGELSLRFSSKEESLRSKDEISVKTDEWKVAFYISKDPCRYFKEYEEALEYFKELYQRHGLERHRVAYIDERIARQEKWKGDLQKKREKGIIFFKKGVAVSIIAGVIVAILWSVFAGIAVGLFGIAVAGIYAWNEWIEQTKERINSYEEAIEELKSEKHRIPAF